MSPTILGSPVRIAVKTQRWGLAASALLVLAAFVATNVIATGGWKPFYAYYGTEKYLWTVDGQQSYWLTR